MSRRIIRQNDIYKPIQQQTPRKTDEELHEDAYINHDHPDTIGNGSATFLYIVVMMVSTLFNDRLLIYIAASWIYFTFINRRAIRKKEWSKKYKNGGNK